MRVWTKLTAATLGLGLILACAGGDDPPPELASPAPEIVAAHTAGSIRSSDDIVVQLTADVPDAQPGAEVDLIRLFPSVPGKATWTSPREITFVPDQPLASGVDYTVQVALSTLDPAWTDFGFQVSVVPLSARIVSMGLEAQAEDGAVQRFRGSVVANDFLADADAEAMLSATFGTEAVAVTWTHNSPLDHGFTIEGLRRADQPKRLTLSLDTKRLGDTEAVEHTVDLPGTGTFVVTDIQVQAGIERYVDVQFSDPVDPKQKLDGLITVDGHDGLSFDVQGSTVRIDSSSGWQSPFTVNIRDVKNTRGVVMAEPVSLTRSFDPQKPAARFVGSGVVLPRSQSLTVPIEVANLRSVVVTAYQVFDDNMGQFLQVNPLDGDRELSRVGRVVWKQRVDVGSPATGDWSRVGLDLSPLVAAHPGGMYRLELDFTRSDVVWTCPTPAPPAAPVSIDHDGWQQGDAESSYWDSYEDSDGIPGWQLYEQREDPCSPGYYREYYDHKIRSGRNVLLSNLGLTAKMGEDRRLLAFATDLDTAMPRPGVAVQVLDYQQQVIAESTTDREGMVTFAGLDRAPFVLRADEGQDAAWVKLDRGSANAVSHFDVGGTSVAEGLKGAFYAERGVWRPGDDIFLTFVLFDENGTLPSDHPVQFELIGPTGNRVEHRTLTKHVDRFYDVRTATPADAPTGPYTARVRVGGRTFERTVRIEAIVPNRLKIDLDYGTERIDGPNPRLTATLNSRWLHGGKAPGLNTAIEMRLAPMPTTFPAYEEYSFDSSSRFEASPLEVFTGQLDDQGTVAIDTELFVPDGAPGMLQATFTTRVFEPSGAASIDEGSIPLSPHARYVGVKFPKGDKARGMLLTDTEHPVDIVMLDAAGKPVDGEVEVQFYKMHWRWWWESGSNDLADYIGKSSMRPLKQGLVTLKGGKGVFPVEVKYPDWGRYVVVARDTSGTHSASKVVYIDWPGWAGRASGDNPGGASVLSVTAAENKVEVGDDIVLNIPTSRGGRALVTLETGTQVVDAAWVEATGETTTHRFKATGAMAPNIYAHVTLVQPHASANDLPIRMYGIVPIEVVDPATKLAPVITTADVLEPESRAKIQVSESSGKPMTYTLAVVDEGLLGLTRFQTPNLWGEFYRREALGVRTWDLFSMVAGATGGALESVIAIGGGDEAAAAPPAKANRFPPVVKVLGPFRLDANKTASHEVDLPPYIGEVRVMVVAGRDGAFGSAERSVPVRKPLMLLATLPRVLGPSEALSIPVSVFALDAKVRDVTVTIEAEGPIQVDGKKQTLRFADVGDQMVTFPAKVLDAIGIARVTVKAEGGGEVSEQVIEIDVRHPGLPQQRAIAKTVAPGETWNAEVDVFGLAGSNDALVELSTVPPMDLERRLDQLIRYPHGCAEQTTSGAFPQVYLTTLLELPDDRAATVQKHIQAAVSRLRSYQNADGSFGYWPGAGTANDWTSTYVGHFLVEAERAGYFVPADMKAAWSNYQTAAANTWMRNDARSDFEQAYRLHTLALAGRPALGAMNRLKEARNLSADAKWRLAAAYHLAGQSDTAKALIAGLAVDPSTRARELGGTFGSFNRDLAMRLDALALIAPSDPRTLELANRVSSTLVDEQWLSTQETAQALVAMARFATAGGKVMDASYTLDGGPKTAIKGNKPVGSAPLATGDSDAQLALTNHGATPLFARVVTRGLPPVGEAAATSSGLEVRASYSLAGVYGAIAVDTLEQGTDFWITVTVSNTSRGNLEQLALTQILPSGWEVHGTAPGKGTDYTYRDVRDDRVMTYFDLPAGQSKTFQIGANASYLGHFYFAGAHVEAMYDADIHASTTGQWVDVTASGPQG